MNSFCFAAVAKNLNETDVQGEDLKFIFKLLKGFFDKVDFGKDLEQTLLLLKSNIGKANYAILYKPVSIEA